MNIFKLKPYILPTDIVLFAYLVVTSIYVLIFHQHIDSLWQIMGARVLIVLVMGQIMLLHKITNSIWIKELHLLIPLLLMGYLYGETHYMNQAIFHENLDPLFVQLDQSLFGMQPSILFSQYYNSHFFSELMYLGYISYYFQIIGITAVYYFKDKIKLPKTIFLIFNSFLIYYLVYAVLPVVGPQFHFDGADALPIKDGFFAEFMQWINHNFEKPTGAFPSSHVGMTFIFAFLALKTSKKLFYIFLPFTVLIIFSTVYIKAHYAVDIIGGIISAPIVFYISSKAFRLLSSE